MENEEKLGKYVSILSRNIKRILNEEVSKGRLYKCTDLGLEVLTKLK